MNCFITHKYYYNVPLCGQTFTKTPNSKTWIVYNTFIYDIFFNIINPFFYGHIYPEQLFNFFYILSFIILLIIYKLSISYSFSKNKILLCLFTKYFLRLWTT